MTVFPIQMREFLVRNIINFSALIVQITPGILSKFISNLAQHQQYLQQQLSKRLRQLIRGKKFPTLFLFNFSPTITTDKRFLSLLNGGN